MNTLKQYTKQFGICYVGITHYETDGEERLVVVVYNKTEGEFVYQADQPIKLKDKVIEEVNSMFNIALILEEDEWHKTEH